MNRTTRKRRKQGERFPVGYIKNQILLIVCQHYPKGIEEPDLREILREQFGIRESKGIKQHLRDLEENALLDKVTKKGKANLWKIPQKPKLIKKLGWEATPTFAGYAEEFLFSKDRRKFLESSYAKAILTDDRINQIAQGLWINYKEQLRLIVETFNNLEKELADPSRYKISEKIRKSPTLLSFLLFPEKTIVGMAKEFEEEVI